MLTTVRCISWPFLCTILALILPPEVIAQTHRGSELTIAGSVLNFSYQEFDNNGTLLDREDGNIPGFVLGLSQTSERWVFAGDFSYHVGDVLYKGQTQTGIPVSTRTMEYIADLALRTEYWPENDFALYLGAGYHHWDRDILPGTDVNGNAVGGLFESYAWWTGYVGAKAVMYRSRSASWIVDARLLQIIKPTINVTFGQYDNLTMALGERMGFKLSLPWRHNFSRSASMSIVPYAEYYELGRSANTPLTSNGSPSGWYVFEPRSQTANYGLTLGISQHF